MTTDDQQARPAAITTPTDREIHIERVFDAPRERVFAAFTDAELIPKWWGLTTVVDQMDVRAGGSWRFVAHNEDGSETAFRGSYREVTPPERIVQTFASEYTTDRVHLQTFTFDDLGERTKLTTTMLFDHRGARRRARIRRGTRGERDLCAPGRPAREARLALRPRACSGTAGVTA